MLDFEVDFQIVAVGIGEIDGIGVGGFGGIGLGYFGNLAFDCNRGWSCLKCSIGIRCPMVVIPPILALKSANRIHIGNGVFLESGAHIGWVPH